MPVINTELIRDLERIKDREAKIHAAALMYAEAGFFIVPIRINGKALPGKSHNFNYSHASKKRKVVDRWFGPEGKFAGWNIGIATGRRDGTFVLDLDTHGDVDGISTFEGLIPDDFTFNGPVQSTPSGGKHLVFDWRESASSSTSKIGEGIDTRGGTEDECKGHIVVWPSIVNGRAYQWEKDGETETPPEWLIQKLGRPWRTAEGSGRGNEYIGEDDVEDSFTTTQIAKMLSFINPDELAYAEWVEILCAIHSQHPDSEGLRLADEWSEAGERYERNEVHGRWAGFNEGGAVRIGTLIHYAKQRGYQLGEVEEPNRDQLDEIVAKLNETFAIVPMGSDIFVLEEVDVPDEIRRIKPHYRILKRQGFRGLMENKHAIMATPRGPQKVTHADIWLAHEDRRTYPSGMGMFPGKPERYMGYYNMWGGFAYPEVEGDWSLYQNHVRDIICNGDEDLSEWIFDWMADLVQDPANPKGCAIVMHGVEGCGKGTFAQMIGELFGVAFKHITDEEHLVGRFNGHLADCVVAFADEVTYGGNRKVAGKLKSLVTERFITSERKGIDAVQFHNCTHLLIASNESWFIPAGPQSRRWLVLDVAPERANDRVYFNAIHKQMEENGGLQAMLYDLQRRKVTRDLKKAPETQALFSQRGQYAAMDSVVAWWSSQLAKGMMNVPDIKAEFGEGGWPNCVSKSDLLVDYSQWCVEFKRRSVSDDRFFKTMLKFGLKLSKFRVGGRDGKRVYGYKVPDYEDALETLKREHGINLIEEEIQDAD
jgi:hypothetical protein